MKSDIVEIYYNLLARSSFDYNRTTVTDTLHGLFAFLYAEMTGCRICRLPLLFMVTMVTLVQGQILRTLLELLRSAKSLPKRIGANHNRILYETFTVL